MGKNSITTTDSASEKPVSESLPAKYAHEVNSFFVRKGSSAHLSDTQDCKDFHSHLFRHFLKVKYVERGRVSCFFTILPAFINIFNGLHGGVIASIAERLAIACVTTVVEEDKHKQLFLGELSMSYLSAAPLNEECIVEGWIARSGRNISVVAAEFRIMDTNKLVYTARATVYHMPISKL